MDDDGFVVEAFAAEADGGQTAPEWHILVGVCVCVCVLEMRLVGVMGAFYGDKKLQSSVLGLLSLIGSEFR